MLSVEAQTYDVPFHEVELRLRRQEKRGRLLRERLEKSEVIFSVICDDESGSSALWFVRKNPLSVRHYEAGAQRSEGIQKQVAVLMKTFW